MTSAQALTTLHWFRCMSGAVEETKEDLEVIEQVILPILKDDHNVIPGNDITYHQMYEQWMVYILPDLHKQVNN